MKPAKIASLVQLAARRVVLELMRVRGKVSSREIKIPNDIHEDLRNILAPVYVQRYADHEDRDREKRLTHQLVEHEQYGVTFGRSRVGHRLISRNRLRHCRKGKYDDHDTATAFHRVSVQTLYAQNKRSERRLGGIIKRSLESIVIYRCPDCNDLTIAYGGTALGHHNRCVLNVETRGF